MSTLAVEMARAKANGDRPVAGFTGGQRSLDNVALEVGDKFTLPEKYTVYETMIGENKAEYIWIEVNGMAKKFFPSTFTKSRRVYNEDMTPTETRVHTNGTAAELYRQFGTVKEGMEALAGKTVVVSDIQTIRSLNFIGTRVVNVQIPVIDLVE